MYLTVKVFVDMVITLIGFTNCNVFRLLEASMDYRHTRYDMKVNISCFKVKMHERTKLTNKRHVTTINRLKMTAKTN